MTQYTSRKQGTVAELSAWLSELRQLESQSLDDDTHGGCLFLFGICLLFIPLIGILSLMQTMEGKNIGTIVSWSMVSLAIAIPSILRGRKDVSQAGQNRFHPARLDFAGSFLQLLAPKLAKPGVSLEGDLRQLPRTDMELLHDFAKPVQAVDGRSSITRTWLQANCQLPDGIQCDICVRTQTQFRVVRKPGFRSSDGTYVKSYTCIDEISYQSEVTVKLASANISLSISEGENFQDWSLETSTEKPGTVRFIFTIPQTQGDFHQSLNEPGSREAYLKVDPRLTPEILMRSLDWARQRV